MMTKNQTTFGRDGNVRHKGTVVGSYVRHQGEFEHDGYTYRGGIVATLDQGEVIAEPSDHGARRKIEAALRERALPTPEERVRQVVDYLDTMEIVALDIEGAEVERGQGGGWDKDPTAHWLTVRTPHARVEVHASFNKHGGWNREPGVFALGDTLYEDAEGAWRTFTRRGIEDSFYDDDGSQAETLLGTQPTPTRRLPRPAHLSNNLRVEGGAAMGKLSKSKLKWVITLVVAGLIAVAAVVGVIYGVATHSEPGRLQVCWQGGAAVYAEPGDDPPCDPVELRWGRSPLAVVAIGHEDATVEPWQHEETRRAVQELNTQAGRELLVVRDSSQGSDIAVVWGVPRSSSRGPAETCRHFQAEGSDRAGRAEVDVYATGDQPLAFRVLLHGLGHAVTLAHDPDNRQSIMHPSTPDASLVEAPAWLTDTDRRLLREEGP